jgi:hypothetical protein
LSTNDLNPKTLKELEEMLRPLGKSYPVLHCIFSAKKEEKTVVINTVISMK